MGHCTAKFIQLGEIAAQKALIAAGFNNSVYRREVIALWQESERSTIGGLVCALLASGYEPDGVEVDAMIQAVYSLRVAQRYEV